MQYPGHGEVSGNIVWRCTVVENDVNSGRVVINTPKQAKWEVGEVEGKCNIKWILKM